MFQPARDDHVGRLLATTPVDLRWAGEHLEDGASATALAARIEAALGDPAAFEADKRGLLAEAAIALRRAAASLARSEAREIRHRANNLLQSAENADFLLSRPLRPGREAA